MTLTEDEEESPALKRKRQTIEVSQAQLKGMDKKIAELEKAKRGKFAVPLSGTVARKAGFGTLIPKGKKAGILRRG